MNAAPLDGRSQPSMQMSFHSDSVQTRLRILKHIAEKR